MTARVAVVGGGIAGLATAWHLRAAADPPAVSVIERSQRLGGKLCTGEVGGVRVELGADSFLTRPEHAERLCHRLGLGDDIVAPSARNVQLWSRGRCLPLPAGIQLGVPTRLGPLLTSGLLSTIGLARAALDLVLPRSTDLEHASVGTFVRSRFGGEVVERLVDPLLGGVYAGDVDRLSVIAATPQLAEAARLRRSLLFGLREVTRRQETGPISRTLRGGLSRLVDRLQVDPQGRGQVDPQGRSQVDPQGRSQVDPQGRGLEVRCPATARRVVPVPGGYRVELVDAEPLEVDSVVLAVPAFTAAALLRDAAPSAASVLDTIPYASVGIVTLIYPPGTQTPSGSGLLVPSREGRLVKAATWVSSKWPHVTRDGYVVVRVSVGRYGAPTSLEFDDAELVAAVRSDLGDMGIRTAPTSVEVTRWERALPQYEVGHLDRVQRVEQELAQLPGVAVTGAAYRGVGIAACIRQAQETAARLLGLLRQSPPAAADREDTPALARDGWSGATGGPPPRRPRQ